MKWLFLDTSHFLSVGLFNATDNEWIDFRLEKVKQNSGRIHSVIYSLLTENNLEISDLTGVFLVSGPGSYTGMRLSEGVAQVLEWQGIKVVSDYHFNIPKRLGEENYLWFCNAFKGELFVFEGSTQKKFLVNTKDMNTFIQNRALNKAKTYSHYDQEGFDHIEYTSKLIQENFGSLLKQFIDDQARASIYYFRRAEDEFKVTQGEFAK